MYNYRDSKANIVNILKSATSIVEKNNIPADHEFTYENGIKCWTSAIFVDIKSSSVLFKNMDEKLARLLRAFTSEIITIFQDFDKYNQIGIRGDCVYAIYSTQNTQDISKVFAIATKINTFMKMLNKLLTSKGYSNIGVGIGIGCGKELIIKAGRTGTGINDKIWIGDAVVDAANLSSIANRDGFKKILMNSLFYDNLMRTGYKDRTYITETSCKEKGYYEIFQCDDIDFEFDDWINGGMKDVG